MSVNEIVTPVYFGIDNRSLEAEYLLLLHEPNYDGVDMISCANGNAKLLRLAKPGYKPALATRAKAANHENCIHADGEFQNYSRKSKGSRNSCGKLSGRR